MGKERQYRRLWRPGNRYDLLRRAIAENARPSVRQFAVWTKQAFSDNIAQAAPYPSGKGVVCKTIMHQFDSDRRLEFLRGQTTVVYGTIQNGKHSGLGV